ncbi:MAG: aminotransferase class V-fold PLP-dependent enzyme [Alphaproteobacteria bacterium]|nr:MAG: aminotransferase class V-fold PLP-dependent enzyme [Alphaproteobacteria bacterium]
MRDPDFTDDELAALRRATPGAARRAHFDNAGSALMPATVVERIRAHLALEADVGGYVAEERTMAEAEDVYRRLAHLLGIQAEDVALTSSASEAFARLLHSVPLAREQVVVTAFNEYVGNYFDLLHRCRRVGAQLRVLPATGVEHALDIGLLEEWLNEGNVALVAIGQVSSSCGQVNDVAAVGRLARAAGVPFLLDASQSLGQMSVNMREIGCDMLVGTARKFLRGPRGVGFLAVTPEMRRHLDPVFLMNNSARWIDAQHFQLRDDARLFEAWEKNVAARLGFGAALALLEEVGIERAGARARRLAGMLRERLAALPGIEPCDPPGSRAAIVTFRYHGLSADGIKAALEAQDIAVQVSRAEHTPLDLGPRGIDAAVRVSPHYYNTEDEIERLIRAIGRLSSRV